MNSSEFAQERPQVSKKDIALTLKGLGLGFVKLSTGEYNSVGKVYTHPGTGKRIKGIRCGQVGPMTVTNAHNEHTSDKMQQIKIALKAIGMYYNDEYMVSNNGKIKLRLDIERYPAFARSANLDPSYQNIYIVPSYV